jgi:hypothetical protein
MRVSVVVFVCCDGSIGVVVVVVGVAVPRVGFVFRRGVGAVVGVATFAGAVVREVS